VKTIRQILAIARTEFRFSFRRGAVVAVAITIGLLVSTGILVMQLDNLRTSAASLNMTPDEQQKWIANGFTLEEHPLFIKEFLGDMFVSGSILAWLVMLLGPLLLPVASVIAIPADRAYGILELLRTTPITGASYLAGKVLGTLTAVLLTAAAMLAAFFGVINVILYTNLHFGLSWSASLYFIKFSLLDGIPLLAWGTVIGILVGVLFRSRLAAVFPGLVAGAASVYFWVAAFGQPTESLFVDKVEYFLLQNYHSPATEMIARVYGQVFNLFGLTGRIGLGQVVWMYATILAALVTLAILARLWLHWKENF